MSVNKRELIEIIENIAPKELMEPWDNTGIQIHTERETAERILVCLDVNMDTIAEAVEKKCDYIVSHHPMFFEPLKRISAEDPPGRCALKLIAHGISVYSSHTSFDTVEGGNNDYLADLFDLEKVEIPEAEPIMRTGFFPEPISMREACDLVAEKLGHIYPIKYAGDENRSIGKVAICSGAGGSLIGAAKALDCDLLITGDLKYHDALFAQEVNMNVIDGGHFETEILFIKNMGGKLVEALSHKAEVIFSLREKNALKNYGCTPTTTL